MDGYTAWVLRRLICARCFIGDLQDVLPEFRGFILELASLRSGEKLVDSPRHQRWEEWLEKRIDFDVIVYAIAGQDPDGSPQTEQRTLNAFLVRKVDCKVRKRRG